VEVEYGRGGIRWRWNTVEVEAVLFCSAIFCQLLSTSAKFCQLGRWNTVEVKVKAVVRTGGY
jgi:hypothetical protein